MMCEHYDHWSMMVNIGADRRPVRHDRVPICHDAWVLTRLVLTMREFKFLRIIVSPEAGETVNECWQCCSCIHFAWAKSK
jgi:hypothetical protein